MFRRRGPSLIRAAATFTRTKVLYHPWLRPYLGLVSLMTVAASRMKFNMPATLAELVQSVGSL